MPEKVSSAWMWADDMLWSVIVMFVMGSMARTFVSKEPFDIKKFIGEIIFSCIGAVLLYSGGLMQGMSDVQLIAFGSLASLGGVRVIEWVMKIAYSAREGGPLKNDN